MTRAKRTPGLTKVTISRDTCYECGQPKGSGKPCTLTINGRHRFTSVSEVDLKKLFTSTEDRNHG